MTIHGAAHVAGTYHVNTPATGSFVLDGTELIKDLGMGAVKIFMSHEYATNDYQLETWSGIPTTLTTMAQLSELTTLFGDGTLQHYLINTFGFVSQGSNDLWKFGLMSQPNLLSNEYTEIYNLTVYLLTTYAGTGKTFVLQNWESDWAYLGVADPDDYSNLTRRWEDMFIAYHRARAQAVEAARRATGQNDVRVLYALECNRVLDAIGDAGKPRVLTRVLPKLRGVLDLVSWSAYDAIYLGGTSWHANAAAQLSYIQTQIPIGLAAPENAAGCPAYIGEWGVAENELPIGYNTGDIVETVFNAVETYGCPYHIYWQVFDNEGTPPANRGFWLYDDGGALTNAGTKFQTLLV